MHTDNPASVPTGNARDQRCEAYLQYRDVLPFLGTTFRYVCGVYCFRGRFRVLWTY